MSSEFEAAVASLAEAVRLRLAQGPRTDAQLAKELGVSQAQLHLALGVLLQGGAVGLAPKAGAIEARLAAAAAPEPASAQAMTQALNAFASAQPEQGSKAGVIPDPLSLAEAEQP